MTTSTDRGLLAELDGHDVLAGRASRHGLTLLTRQQRSWPGRSGEQRGQEPGERRPGSRLIATGAVLLFLLGLGLLAVSFAAQYQYVLNERHQHIASLIEAGALDVGMIIFALLAMGLGRAGKPAKIERAAVVACAAGLGPDELRPGRGRGLALGPRLDDAASVPGVRGGPGRADHPAARPR